jgi:ABC-type branched-subunit amino acid transport system ATPase component
LEHNLFKALTLQNFSVFKSESFCWVNGINVLVGANGTGKTHLMKLMYCLQQTTGDAPKLSDKLAAVFRPSGQNITRLVNRQRGTHSAEITLSDESSTLNLSFDNGRKPAFLTSGALTSANAPVYIPAKEVLSIAPGFISLYDKYQLAFEEVYYDIIKQAYLPPRKDSPLSNPEPLLELLRKTIGGKVTVDGDEFSLLSGNSKTEVSLVAEGHRKLALLWQLIHNGTLFDGNTLYWDEPEANLNPLLMKDVVQVLIMLAQRGIQVFIATHNYAFLRELDFAASAVPIRYFSLAQQKSEGVKATTASRYQDISPNLIADEYQRLYDLEIQNSLGTL